MARLGRHRLSEPTGLPPTPQTHQHPSQTVIRPLVAWVGLDRRFQGIRRRLPAAYLPLRASEEAQDVGPLLGIWWIERKRPSAKVTHLVPLRPVLFGIQLPREVADQMEMRLVERRLEADRLAPVGTRLPSLTDFRQSKAEVILKVSVVRCGCYTRLPLRNCVMVTLEVIKIPASLPVLICDLSLTHVRSRAVWVAKRSSAVAICLIICARLTARSIDDRSSVGLTRLWSMRARPFPSWFVTIMIS